MSDTPTIRALLCGGLGNQLFQYAFARALGLRSGARLELDAVTLFERDRIYRRSFELDAFRIPDEVGVCEKKPVAVRLRRKWAELRSRGKPLERRAFVNEPRPLRYYPEFALWKVRRDVTLLGYWQCEDYFKEYEATIRQDLGFLEGVHTERTGIVAEISSTSSVAVHVRRTDYSRALDLPYYEKAIPLLREQLPDARFFIFTDAIDWWRENGIKSDDIRIVEPLDLPAIEDFKLMSLCRHFIIANSSYSWWAAWLGEGHDKIVIAPGPEHWSNPDTVPESWRVI